MNAGSHQGYKLAPLGAGPQPFLVLVWSENQAQNVGTGRKFLHLKRR